jgi:alpha-ketoglutarate-dependent taurine dioxygenase
MATTANWTISPITGSPERGTFGADLSGGTLNDPTDLSALADLLPQHLVLVLRGQHLDHAGQVALARALGEPTPAHPVVPGHPDHPEILELDGAQGGRNARWHTDVTFVPEPPAASVLVADLTPPSGGDTLWADMRTAHTMLSPGIAALVDDLDAVHRISPLAYWGEPFDTALSREDAAELFERSLTVPPVVHPIVRVHPVTGRPALFVNPGFTSHVVGMSRIESDHLLQMLYAHATQPEFVLRHRWQTGDVVIWDNRATMHYAADDYGTAERRMRRVTVRGDRPFAHSGAESRVVDDPLLAVR